MTSDARIPRSAVVLLAYTLAAAGCQLLVDLNGLEDQSCPPEYKACNGECVSESDTATGCGDPGCNPCAPKHAKAICDQKNHCSFTPESCIEPWKDCNGADDDGCETDIDHTPKHCGGCNQACPDPPNGFAGCYMGNCVIGKCADSWGDCDNNPLNGCEHPIWTDLECVACRAPCAEGTSCDHGICRVPISDGGAG